MHKKVDEVEVWAKKRQHYRFYSFESVALGPHGKFSNESQSSKRKSLSYHNYGLGPGGPPSPFAP
jgi:hypothetical protein